MLVEKMQSGKNNWESKASSFVIMINDFSHIILKKSDFLLDQAESQEQWEYENSLRTTCLQYF